MFNSLTRSLVTLSLLSISFLSHANTLSGTPFVTVTFVNGLTTMTTSSTGTANYVVHVDSGVLPSNYALNFTVRLPTWAAQDTADASLCSGISVCASPFALKANESCCLMLHLNGSQLSPGSHSLAPQVITTYPVYNGYAAAKDITVTGGSGGTATLSISAPTLTLAQAGIFTSTSGAGAQTSKARRLTIMNAGPGAAEGFTIGFSPALSGGSTYTTTCTSPLPVGTCTVTVKPGSATSTAGNPPVTNTMTISAINGTSTPSTVITTLTYGSLYGSGYVFSIDDTPAANLPMGQVKIAGTSDQSAGIVWDADGACYGPGNECTLQTNAWETIYGSNQSSVPGSTNPSGTGSNGPGNTWLISSILNGQNGDTNGPPANYAAGLCINDNTGSFTDWYLPAICEMGYGQTSQTTYCGTQSTPELQNMQSNLIDFTGADSTVASGLYNGGNSGNYWSSTEFVALPQSQAWYQSFALGGSGGGSQQNATNKISLFGIRCVRAFIP